VNGCPNLENEGWVLAIKNDAKTRDVAKLEKLGSGLKFKSNIFSMLAEKNLNRAFLLRLQFVRARRGYEGQGRRSHEDDYRLQITDYRKIKIFAFFASLR